jgi:quaternary ammonium compound-resistance protein SugE
MPWLWLIIAGILEVAWAVGLKYADGFTKTWPSVITVLLMLASFWCLAQAVRGLPLGTSYAIWTGIGAVGTAILGMILFKEPATVGPPGLHGADRGRHCGLESAPHPEGGQGEKVSSSPQELWRNFLRERALCRPVGNAQHRLFAELSRMFGQEVPLYDKVPAREPRV